MGRLRRQGRGQGGGSWAGWGGRGGGKEVVHGQVGEGGEGARRWFMGRLTSNSTTEPFRSGLQSLSVIGQIMVSVVR